MKNTLLALDIGTKTGWTINGMDGYTYKMPSTDERFALFYTFLEEHIDAGIESIVYEDAGFQKYAAAPVFHGLAGVLKAITTLRNIPLQAMPVGTIKKIFTGKARYSEIELRTFEKALGLKHKKEANRKAPTLDMCKKLGYTWDGEDAADALSVHYTYRKLYGN